MSRAPVALAMLALAGCSSSPSGSSSDPPSSCNPSTRSGTYLFTYTTVSGNCGAIASGLVNLGAAAMNSAMMGCTRVSSMLSKGSCELSDVLDCPGNVTITEVSTEQAADGSSITGEVSVSSPSCAGTYDLTATRQ